MNVLIRSWTIWTKSNVSEAITRPGKNNLWSNLSQTPTRTRKSNKNPKPLKSGNDRIAEYETGKGHRLKLTPLLQERESQYRFNFLRHRGLIKKS